MMDDMDVVDDMDDLNVMDRLWDVFTVKKNKK